MTVNVARPYSAVCPGLEGEVLHTLAGTKMGLTGRQVALLTGRSSHSGVLQVLNRLVEHGLVDRVELNRAFLFALNRDHLAAPAVIALAELRTDLLNRIQHELGKWGIAPMHMSLFGSAARGDGATNSDIDLFVVRPAAIGEDDPGWRDQLGELAGKIERWTGNRATMIEVAKTELAWLSTANRPIVAALRSDAIVLSGADLSELLGDE